ncbi:hypothetical protein JOC95_001840 [Bacillus tianshenii]|uniref:Lipoprotein n=2 Tax=Sutcliffiella tianshenii TaxID=1463404 RepID=A0ABS2NZT4_9BACI|nr:hypothetical protein [Bacillus tianshenii]
MGISFLTGCVSGDAKEFIREQDVKDYIEEEIIRLGEEDYGLTLVPDTEEMKFGFQNGIPLRDENKVSVPVKVKGDPVFKFQAIVLLEDNSENKKEIQTIDVAGEYGKGLKDFGGFLLAELFKKKHEKVWKQIEGLESGIKVDQIEVLAKTSAYIEDPQEEESIVRNISEDYKEGEFSNIQKYEELMEKYLYEGNESLERGYLPEISISIEPSFNSTAQETFDKVVAFLQESDHLPKGEYSVSYYKSTNGGESLHELIFVE